MNKLKPSIICTFLVCLLTACSFGAIQRSVQKDATDNPALTTTLGFSKTQSLRITPIEINHTLTPKITATRTALVQSNVAATNQPAPVLALTSSSTPRPTKTRQPFHYSTRSIPIVTVSARKTLEAFGDACEPDASKEEALSGLSPDGNWIAIACTAGGQEESSYLQVISIDGRKEWRIYYKDYAANMEVQSRNEMRVFHWSQDGRFLYAASETIGSGCCWIGWDTLLVRLNLDSGHQTAIVNLVPYIFQTTDFSFSPSDRYLLYSLSSKSLTILDLQTWKKRVIELKYKNTGAGYALMSKNDDKVILVLREYPEVYQGDLTFGSLVLIDLPSGSQKKLLAGIDYNDTPIPVSWQDEDHVLLRNDDTYSLLNIHSAEVIEIENP